MKTQQHKRSVACTSGYKGCSLADEGLKVCEEYMAYVCLVPVLSVHQRRSAARSAACLRRREAYLPRTGTVIVRGPELVGGCGGGGERKCRARAFPMCASGEGRRSQSG